MKRHLNLLPWTFQRRMLVRRRLGQWSAVCVVSTMLLGGVWLWEARARDLEQSAIDNLERRASPILGMMQRNQKIEQRLKLLEGGQSLLGELEPEQLSYHLLAAVSKSASQCSGRIQVQQFTLERTQQAKDSVKDAAKAPPKEGAAQKEPETEEVCKVTIKGIGTDNLAVAQFVAALRESSLFQKVELKSAVGGADARGQGRSYIIECSL